MSLQINNGLIGLSSYVGPPVIIQRAVATVNAGSIFINFPHIPDVGDLVLFIITSGANSADPSTVPSGFSLNAHRDLGGGTFMFAVYSRFADGITNSFTFAFTSAGSIGLCGYQIRYAGAPQISTNFKSSSSTFIDSPTAVFDNNSLGIGFFTISNTGTGPPAFNNSYGNVLDCTPSLSPMRVGGSAEKTYLTGTTQGFQGTWGTSRTALSGIIEIISTSP